jgi:hypothetical protein
MPHSFETKRKCIERELGYRRRVYPKWVADKRMSQQFADEQIAIMEEIAADLRKMEEGERLF